jgi:hypothetical protein
MNLKCLVMFAAAAGLLSAQDAKSVIDSAAKAMGNLKTVEYSGSGSDFVLGQAVNPNAAWPRFNDKTYTRSLNFDQAASHMHRARTPSGGGLQPIFGERLVHPYHPHFAELLDSLKIDPQTIIPIHLPAEGRTITKAELLRMAGKPTQVAQVR